MSLLTSNKCAHILRWKDIDVSVLISSETRASLVKDERLVGIEDDGAAIRTTVLAQLDSSKNGSRHTLIQLDPRNSRTFKPHQSCANRVPDCRHRATVTISASFLLPTGTTILQITGGQLPPQFLLAGDKTLPFNGPSAIHILYNDHAVAQSSTVLAFRGRAFGDRSE